MVRRNIEKHLLAAVKDTPVVLLNGARQTGKTTLIESLASQWGAQYFTLDDLATLSLATADPSGFIRNLAGPVAIDEIQKAPALFSAIKLAVDRQRQPGRFLLTGSANVMTLPHLAESLVGRMEIIPLYPFSMGEISGHQEQFVARLFSDASLANYPMLPARDNLEFILTRGGYPEAITRDKEDRRAAWFEAYISTLLQRDVRDLARVDSLHQLPNLLKLLAARTAGLLNLADVGRDAGLSYSTLNRYLALLECVFLVQRLPAWSSNFGQRLVKAQKAHLMDTGLACHLLGANPQRLADDRNLLGRILESFVIGELRKQIAWTDPQIRMFHFRTTAGVEVDCLLEKPDGSVAALEIKASATVSASDFAGIKYLREQIGERLRTGVILYLGDQLVPFGDRLALLPISTLWAP